MRPIPGGLLIAVVLLLNLLAASPTLHESFHPDAGKAQHHCAVTLFAHGQADSVTVDVSPAIATVAVHCFADFEISTFAPAIESLPAGRAPPVTLLYS
jgi:hypothetical protein